jgi:hypothetical protein
MLSLIFNNPTPKNMQAYEARALMPRNCAPNKTFEQYMEEDVYPQIRSSAQGDSDGVGIYVPSCWVDRIKQVLETHGFKVFSNNIGCRGGQASLSIQWTM